MLHSTSDKAGPARGSAAASRGWPELRAGGGIVVAAGVWLIVATAVFGPSLSLEAAGPAWNELACGTAVAVVAWVSLFAPRGAPWAGAVTAVLGVWLVVAAWSAGRPAADHPVVARFNELIAGIVIAVVSVVSVLLARRLRPEARTAG